MKRKRLHASTLLEDPIRSLQEVVDALNDGEKADPRMTPANHERFLRLVRAWKEAIASWESASVEEKKKCPALLMMKVPRQDKVQLRDIERAFDWRLVPAGNGGASLFLSPTGENFRDVVAVYFGRLILNPLCERLGGPCLKCGRYYVRQTKRDSVFCTRKCAGGAMQTRLNLRKHTKKLDRAKRAIKNYRTRPPRYREMDWKEWVVLAEPDNIFDTITRSFLTRAVNKGELFPPDMKGTK